MEVRRYAVNCVYTSFRHLYKVINTSSTYHTLLVWPFATAIHFANDLSPWSWFAYSMSVCVLHGSGDPDRAIGDKTLRHRKLSKQTGVSSPFDVEQTPVLAQRPYTKLLPVVTRACTCSEIGSHLSAIYSAPPRQSRLASSHHITSNHIDSMQWSGRVVRSNENRDDAKFLLYASPNDVDSIRQITQFFADRWRDNNSYLA
jgi:hypothetical protein